MPQLDMPLADLKKYSGINPRSESHDEYWSRALGELDNTPPDVKFTPSADFSARNADCFDLYFTGVGGAKIYAKYLRPKPAQKTPVMLMFHGYCGSSGDWNDKLAYVNEGYTVLAMDVRGQGGKSRDTLSASGTTQNGHIVRGLDGHEDGLFYRNVFLDTAQLARIATTLPGVDSGKICCLGGSQGGALSAVCASLAPDIIKFTAITHPFLSDFKRVYEMDLCRNAYNELSYYFRTFSPTMADAEKIFTKLGFIDIQFLVGRIKAKVYFGIGLMDDICPPSSQMAAFNKIVSEKFLDVYPNHGHEYYPGYNDKVMMFFNNGGF